MSMVNRDSVICTPVPMLQAPHQVQPRPAGQLLVSMLVNIASQATF